MNTKGSGAICFPFFICMSVIFSWPQAGNFDLAFKRHLYFNFEAGLTKSYSHHLICGNYGAPWAE
jgi:hypothetical protein